MKSAIQLAPANARYRRSLGVVHESAQQWPAAADAFERAIEKQPNDVQVRFDSAVYWRMKQPPLHPGDSSADCVPLIDFHGDGPASLISRVPVCQSPSHELVLTCVYQITAGFSGVTLLILAGHLPALGHQSSLHHSDHAIFVCCVFQAHMHLARVLKRADRDARAAEVYRAVLKLKPDHPQAHYKLAGVLKALGKHEAAAEQYRSGCAAADCSLIMNSHNMGSRSRL